ncbi:hypothetical protein PAXRUDRAFT_832567 [Paxillus rubicundulus Ve08.2h10]|uniref:Dol-P-Man:Man(5)GlcNAc(2)-PP-Dol alpha-1,3-mannosyltransferase n=1 Tax=Paxillus rubicundulus Ve08.2h10 TaxID=930991 RepID=A0A0D0DQX3_9AGAM|nr:hypothetical protein PAXRUDRAFT_832567 [Paxillus rubicundulus Ve08.2h10]
MHRGNVKHLPPVVKQLLTLRNPDVWPSPPLERLHRVFTSTLNEAKERNAENGWLVLSTCTLLTANRPSSVGHLYQFITRSDPSLPETRRSFTEAVDRAAMMREAALKSVIFVGVPRTILSLTGLRDALEHDVYAALRKSSIREAKPDNIEATVQRGMSLWKSIYGPHAIKLYDKLGALHPDFISFIIQAYGTVLSPLPRGDPEQGNLTRALGSVVGIATLRAEGRVGPQLTSHVFGLLKARDEETLSEEDRYLSSDDGTEWVIRKVDEIIDAVMADEQEVMAKVKL